MKIFIYSGFLLVLVASITACGKPQQPSQQTKVYPEFFGQVSIRCSGRRLLAQGFTGAMDRGTVIEFLGKINARSIEYSVYQYVHIGNHEIHRIILLEDGCSYFGSYAIYAKPVSVSGRDIVFDAPKNIGNIIRFTGISPPARVVIDGEIADFGQ